jgi:GcrA cell cycle regulator
MTGRGVVNDIGIPDFDWTDARVVELKAHWATGLSCSDVAAEMGCSRNAVIGKVHRLKLSGRGRDGTPKTQAQRKAPPAERKAVGSHAGGLASKIKTRIATERTPAKDRGLKARINHRTEDSDGDFEALPLPDQASDMLIPIEQRKTLFELTAETCRWPVGHPNQPNFFFCGGKSSSDGGPYCNGHARVACGGQGKGRDPRHYNGRTQI